VAAYLVARIELTVKYDPVAGFQSRTFVRFLCWASIYS